MRTFLLIGSVLLLASPFALAADKGAAPVAAPAFIDVVTFSYRADAEDHKVTVNSSGPLLRVDEDSDGYSVLYNPQTEHYTGLEHRNYTWWEFSWPEVRAAVENSKRHEIRLQDLGNQGLNDDTDDLPPVPLSGDNATNAAPTTVGGDDSGYVWRATTDRKRIADLDCVRWTGETVSGENVEAWCYNGNLPKVQAAIASLRTINGPMALVPVRTVVPDFIFLVYGSLMKGGVTPLLINWGEDAGKSSFRLVALKTRDGKVGFFSVPKLYTKTTLITMDGMIDSQPAPGQRKSEPKKTWQN